MYTFLRNNINTDDATIYAIDADRIETIRESQTYDQFGQECGTYNTGDSLDLLTPKAVEIAQKIADDQEADYTFAAGDFISGYENSNIYDEIETALGKGCKKNEDYSLHFQTVEGFNYWDGSNWKTVTISVEHGEAGYEVIKDENRIAELNAAIENMKFVEEGFGTETYETEDFIITKSAFESNFANFQIIEK